MSLVDNLASQATPQSDAPLSGAVQGVTQGLDAGLAYAAAQQKSDLMGQQLDQMKQDQQQKQSDYVLDGLSKAAKAANPQMRKLILNSVNTQAQKFGMPPFDEDTVKAIASDSGSEQMNQLLAHLNATSNVDDRNQAAQSIVKAMGVPYVDALKQVNDTINSLSQSQNREQLQGFKQQQLDLQGQNTDLKGQLAAAKGGEVQDKVYTELSNKLTTFRGDNAAQQANKNLLASQNALSLVQGKDLNKLTPQQNQLFWSEVAKVSTGGVPTAAGMKELVPNNFKEGFANLLQKVNSDPTAAGQGKFLQQGIDYLNELQNNSQKMVDTYRGNVTKGYYRRLSDDQKNDLLADHPEVAKFLPGMSAQQNAQATNAAIAAPAQTSTVAPPTKTLATSDIQNAVNLGASFQVAQASAAKRGFQLTKDQWQAAGGK